jgi:hypothetical protein
MSPEMYFLIDPKLFNLNIAPTTVTPAHPIKYNPDGAIVPYTGEEKSSIGTNFPTVKRLNKRYS